ncbi:permease-like cell division protein FtsX [Plantactinospora siamensis]|uniref:Permease-like cell division protein FtsX n=1 Tax=Plantactinospora siamensis TaxID=555372 RepID=A0ABV6P535_9ACTN
MDRNLHILFDRALADEPAPTNDLAALAMVAGAGMRRRRQRRMAAGAAAVAAVAALGVVNLPGTGPDRSAPPPRTVQAGFATRMNPTCHTPVREDATDVSVFFVLDFTAGQRDAVERALRADRAVAAVVYETREEAYARFKKRYADAPDLVAAVDVAQIPEGFRAKLADPARAAELMARLRSMPGVDQVVGSSCPSGIDVWSAN